jgi:hypothetical protein
MPLYLKLQVSEIADYLPIAQIHQNFMYIENVRNRFAVVNAQFFKVLELSVLFPFLDILAKIIHQTAEFRLYFFTGLCNTCYCNYYEKEEANTLPI